MKENINIVREGQGLLSGEWKMWKCGKVKMCACRHFPLSTLIFPLKPRRRIDRPRGDVARRAPTGHPKSFLVFPNKIGRAHV